MSISSELMLDGTAFVHQTVDISLEPESQAIGAIDHIQTLIAVISNKYEPCCNYYAVLDHRYSNT